jgi:malonate decarboxylase epsilon subunit
MSGVAAARALTDDRGLVPAFVAGLSIGAFAAAVTAGVLTLAEAMSAVRLRGDLMQQICSAVCGATAAVLGLRASALTRQSRWYVGRSGMDREHQYRGPDRPVRQHGSS